MMDTVMSWRPTPGGGEATLGHGSHAVTISISEADFPLLERFVFGKMNQAAQIAYFDAVKALRNHVEERTGMTEGL